jgi:hypothetical protein
MTGKQEGDTIEGVIMLVMLCGISVVEENNRK